MPNENSTTSKNRCYTRRNAPLLQQPRDEAFRFPRHRLARCLERFGDFSDVLGEGSFVRPNRGRLFGSRLGSDLGAAPFRGFPVFAFFLFEGQLRFRNIFAAREESGMAHARPLEFEDRVRRGRGDGGIAVGQLFLQRQHRLEHGVAPDLAPFARRMREVGKLRRRGIIPEPFHRNRGEHGWNSVKLN